MTNLLYYGWNNYIRPLVWIISISIIQNISFTSPTITMRKTFFRGYKNDISKKLKSSKMVSRGQILIF